MSDDAISNRTKIELALVLAVVAAAVLNERRWMGMEADIQGIKVQIETNFDQRWRFSDHTAFAQRLAILNPGLKVPEPDGSGRYLQVEEAATGRSLGGTK